MTRSCKTVWPFIIPLREENCEMIAIIAGYLPQHCNCKDLRLETFIAGAGGQDRARHARECQVEVIALITDHITDHQLSPINKYNRSVTLIVLYYTGLPLLKFSFNSFIKVANRYLLLATFVWKSNKLKINNIIKAFCHHI